MSPVGRDGKPCKVMRSELTGTWYAVTRWQEQRQGQYLALSRHPVEAESAAQLESMRDAEDWLRALLEATGLTREQVADRFDLTIGKPT